MKKLLFTLCASFLLFHGNAQKPATYRPDLKLLHERIDSCDVDLRAHRKPLIGLSANYRNGGSVISGTYIQAIMKAGGAPVIIPALTDGATLRNIVAELDGLVLTGGEDLNPLWYGEQPRQQLQTVDPVRDVSELKLLKLAADRNIPILGICRGEQLMNVAFGGTLYQDIPSERSENYIKHVQDQPGESVSHQVSGVEDSQLASILGEKEWFVNSFHHQAVKEVAPGFSIADREINRVNLPKMEEGRLDGVFLAAFIWQEKRDDASLQKAVDKTIGLIEGIHEQADRNSDLCGIAFTPDDFIHLKQAGKKAFFIGIENGYGIGKDLNNIARFKKMGVNYITLCHSYDNDICDSSTHTKKEWDGLSPFGEEAVKEMNRQGIMVDLSHASESTFWDVIRLTDIPIICSHSSARALCDHDRNLTDEQLRALAKNGGVVQLCLLDAYINPDKDKASLTDAVEHLDHIIRIAGIDHVGIGSDFDGGGGLIGCEGDNDLIQITVKLIEKGYSEEDIAKIWGGNLMRVMRQVQAAASTNT